MYMCIYYCTWRLPASGTRLAGPLRALQIFEPRLWPGKVGLVVLVVVVVVVVAAAAGVVVVVEEVVVVVVAVTCCCCCCC